MKDISKIIFFLYQKKFKGIINLGTGKKVHLKKIANIIAKKYKKRIIFDDNKKATYLVANIIKLKKIYNKKIDVNLKKMIFKMNKIFLSTVYFLIKKWVEYLIISLN